MPIEKSPPSLPDLQNWMRQVLTHPRGVHFALSHDEKPVFKEHASIIQESKTLNREERLSIYGNGYFSRLVNCLAANYESLKNAMGEKSFLKFAKEYLVRYPSVYKSIDDVGEEIPSLIETHPQSKTKPYLRELAALEWAAHQSFYADDRVALAPQKLEAKIRNQGAKAVLIFDPAVKVIHVNWPVDLLWRANGKMTASLRRVWKKKRLHLLVYRRADKQIRVARLEPAAYLLLRSLMGGESLEKSLSKLSLRQAKNVERWFQEWVSLRLILDVPPHEKKL